MQTRVSGEAALAGASGTANLGARQHGLGSDLGLDDQEPSLLVRGEASTDRFRLRLSSFRHDQSSGTLLNAPFGDLASGTPVNVDLEFLNVKAALSYDLVEFELGDAGVVRLAPGIAANYIDLDISVRGVGIPGFESVRNNVLVPMPFLLGEVEAGAVFAAVDFGGLAADLGDGSGIYWDLDATIGVRPQDDIELLVGYRWVQADVPGRADGRDYDADIDVQGWFVGGGIRF